MGTVLTRPLAAALLWFAVGLVLRLALLHASPDAEGPYAVLFQGDAPYWLQQAAGGDVSPAASLPLRPPAMRWIVGASFDGTAEGLPSLRFAFVLIGALWAPLVFLALRGAGPFAAHVGAALVATASPALQLAVTPSSEAIYGPFVAASIAILPRVRHPAVALAFGAAQGLVCLLRAEHALTALAFAGWLALTVGRNGTARRGFLTFAAVLLGGFAATLPWNIEAAEQIAAFSRRPAPPVPRRLAWEPGAVAELERLAPYLHTSAQRFVEVTVAHRGRRRVTADDVVRVHEEAFGVWPVPAPSGPVFVALYGPLNFRLANGPEPHGGGFSNAALTAPPPLEGGPDRYAPIWLGGLPRDGELNLEYPWHLRHLVHGYRDGLVWMVAEPGAALARFADKVAFAWSGATPTLGGAALPFGAGGLRRAVDITVPVGGWVAALRIVTVLLVAVGLALGWRRPALQPWILHAASVLAVTVAFFGYARLGALWLPVVGAALGIVVERLVGRGSAPGAGRTAARVGLTLVALLVVHDVVRAVVGVRYVVDGREAGTVEPWPPFEFRGRVVEVR